jgi:LysR family glycine cleavage system transcriptional activator
MPETPSRPARLPPFSALRAFEAAARHQNFSRAADELHITHGAVSHQVRALEEELGVALFRRTGRKVSVTADGATLAGKLATAFADMAGAVDALRTGDAIARLRLTVSAIPSFAARWLAPRLAGFVAQHPDIELELHASGHLQDLEREGIDVGIRFGAGRYPGLVVERLMGDVYYPVASPRYRGGDLPSTAQALASADLLRCSDEPWLPWLRAAGLALPEPAGGLLFGDSSMLLGAAVDGDGIALARHLVAMEEISAGQLVRLLDIAVASPADYYFVCPPAAARKPQVRAFRAWLLAEIAKFAPTLPALASPALT